MIDLETLATEYAAAQANLRAQRRVLAGYKQAADDAGNALVAAIIEAGLTEYGPITSTLEWHAPSESHRRIWKAK